MYKNAPLPAGCPPSAAINPADGTRLFRIVGGEKLDANSFLSYRQLYPENKRYRNLCIAFSVSMFTTVEFATAAYQAALARNKVLGTHLAELILKPTDGVCETNSTNGHCSFWFYESCIFEQISCAQIMLIDENS